jgi:hypothetical protein
MPVCREDPERDRQGRSAVPSLLDVGRGKIDRHAPLREGKTRILEGGLHPRPGLADGRRHGAHGREHHHPAAQVDLDVDAVGLNAEYGGGCDGRQHVRSS